LRRLEPARIVVAAPVGARETCERLNQFADEVVCLMAPDLFQAVGLWYEKFTQTTDDEAKRLLAPITRADSATSLLHHNADEA